jgi:hypothetical protein
VSFLNQAIEKIYGLVSFIVADVSPLGISNLDLLSLIFIVVELEKWLARRRAT